MEFNVKEVAVCRVAIFFERSAPPNIFFTNLLNFQHESNRSNLDYQMWFKQGLSLGDSNFDMENYYSLVDVKEKKKVSTTNLTKNV